MKCPEFPPIGVCSNNGYCDETIGKCICNEGWSSVGDFAVEEGADCNINAKTIQGLWVATILLSIPSIFVSLRFLFLRFKQEGKKFEITKPTFTLPFTFIVCCISTISLGIIKATSPTQRDIAKDGALTFLFGTVIATSIITNGIYLGIIAKFLTGYTSMMTAEARNRTLTDTFCISRTTPLFMILQIFGGYCLLFTVGYQNHVYEISIVSFTLIAIADAIFCSLLIFKALSPTIREIENHLKSKSDQNINNNGNNSNNINPNSNHAQDDILYAILRKIRRVRIVVLMVGPVVVAQFIIFGAWKFVLRNMGYVIPILCLFANVTIFGIQSLNNSNTSSSNRSKSIFDPNKKSDSKTDQTSSHGMTYGSVTPMKSPSIYIKE